MSTTFTGTEIADKVGIAESTVRLWTKQFEVPYQKKSGRKLYTTEAYEVIQTIKKLKENYNGIETIRRTIAPEVQPQSELKVEEKSESSVQTNSNEQALVLKNHLSDVVTTAIKENNDLAEKYAKATYTIGQLEKEVEHLSEKIQLLPDAKEHSQIEVKYQLLQNELERLGKENEQLNNQNEALNQSLLKKLLNFFSTKVI